MQATNTDVWIGVQLHSFSTPALGKDDAAAFIPTPLLRRKNQRLSLERKLGGPKGQSGRFRKEINLLLLSGIEPRFLGRPLRNIVIILTVLSRHFVYWERRQKRTIHLRVLRLLSPTIVRFYLGIVCWRECLVWSYRQITKRSTRRVKKGRAS